MYICTKCQKEVATKNDLYYSLCLDCYKELLYDMIEHLGDPDYKIDLPKEEHPIITFFKKLFKKDK